MGHPILGSGAGTFAGYWVRSGEVPVHGGALDAHSLYLETLAELGPIGLILVTAMLVIPLISGLRQRGATYVPAAMGAYLAFLLHAGLDWDWEMPVVTVTGSACAAALVGAERHKLVHFAPAFRSSSVRWRSAVSRSSGREAMRCPAPCPWTEKTPPSGVFSNTPPMRRYGWLPFPFPFLVAVPWFPSLPFVSPLLPGPDEPEPGPLTTRAPYAGGHGAVLVTTKSP